MIPVDLATDVPGTAIKVGTFPHDIAISPDGRTGYVTTLTGVVPVDLTAGTAGRAIKIGAIADAIAITPDGTDRLRRLARLMARSYRSTWPPARPAGRSCSASDPVSIAITPDGAIAYVADYQDGTVTPIDLATGTPGRAISVGGRPAAIAITP